MNEVLMGDYDPTELIAVCDSILEDGEISGDELYTLAEWLNEHREACFHWPGNLLVKPLQDAWADGKLTKTEMRQIGRRLIKIRKEWGRIQSEAAAEDAAEFASDLVRSFDLSQAVLPSIPFLFRVRSETQPGIFYEVDLREPTCTCPDWCSTRSKLPRLHLSRCCKHVRHAYTRCEPSTGWPGWLEPFLNSSFTPHPRQTWTVLSIHNRWALVSTAPTGWANVYTKEDGSWERFGYNLVEDRWSYSIEPPEGDQIRTAILEASR